MTVAPLGWLCLRDQALAAALRDQLAHDQRTSHLDLSVGVDRGVAHVEGEVGSEAERQLVRRLLRRSAGLCAVWDLLSLPGQPLEIIDIGCGTQKQVPWARGVDQVPLPGVDIVADLEGPLPFDANAFDHVFAVHVLEHIRDLVGLMAELHRVLRPSGVLHVLAPSWRHVNAVVDPTHVRYMDGQTFRHFCEERPNVPRWRPLMVATTHDTVHADLQPIKGDEPVVLEELARWFF